MSTISNVQRTRRPSKFSQKFNSITAKLSKGISVPIAILPVAGLLLGISASILNNLPHDTAQGWIQLLNYFKAAGELVFASLPVLFAITIAISFSGDVGLAGFTAFVGWAIFNGLQSALIVPHYANGGSEITHYSALYWSYIPTGGVGNNIGIRSLQTSIFGGILIGSLAAWVYNRFHETKLPSFLGFFAGARSVPIVMIGLLLPLTVLFVMIWPVFALVLNYMGIGLGRLSEYGNINSLIFGYIERSLIPFGIHHAYYAPLWYSSVGGEINLTAPALIGLDNGSGFAVYKVVGVIQGGEVVESPINTWRDILGALNPTADLDAISAPNNWQGDNRYFQQLNAYMVGRELQLQRIWGESDASPETLRYALTYKTFSTSTFNRAAAVALYDADNQYIPIKNIEQLIANDRVIGSDFRPAFPAANIGAYQQGKFAFMIFGIPAAAAAMILAAPKENRKHAISIVGSAALTSFLTGITEPFEFTFLFISPVLFWGVHASLAAISFWLTALLGANIGQTFSGGIIDLIIYGVIPDITLGARANSYIPVLVGLVFIPIYFLVFYFFITRYDLPTPGRGGTLITKSEYRELKEQSRSDTQYSEDLFRALILVDAYGGVGNIQAVDSCITKLRVTVKNPSIIDTDAMKRAGSSGQVSAHDNYIVAIFGTASDNIKTNMRKIMHNKVDVEDLRRAFAGRGGEYNEEESEDEPFEYAPGGVINVCAPVDGEVMTLERLADDSFQLLGQGVAIVPKSDRFRSPVVGQLELIYPAGHAYIFNSDGAKILVHIGIDTVHLNMDTPQSQWVAFVPKLKTGINITTRRTFLQVDWNEIKKFAKKRPTVTTHTPIIVLNESLKNRQVRILVKDGDIVESGDVLFQIY